MTPSPAPLSIFESRLDPTNLGFDIRTVLSGSRYGGGNATTDKAVQTIASIVDAAQTVVDVLADEDGRGYRIGFADAASTGLDNPAFTIMAERKIVLSPKVFADPNLPQSVVATVLTGLVGHEVGHTRTTPGLRSLREAKWPGKSLPVMVSTIFEDKRLELRMVRDFPGLEESFDMTLWWAAREGFASKTYGITPTDHLGDRVNFAIAATRYHDYVGGFATDPETVDELAFWTGLFETVTVDSTDEDMIEVTVKALHRLLDNLPEPAPEEPPVDEPPGPVCGPEGPGGEEPPVEGPEGPTGKGKGKGEGKGGGGNGVADDDDTDPDGEDPEDPTEGGEDETEPGTDDGGTEGGDDGDDQGQGGTPEGGDDEGGQVGPVGSADEDGRHTEGDLEHLGEDLGEGGDTASTGTGQGGHSVKSDAEFDDTIDAHFSDEEKDKVVNPIDDAIVDGRGGRDGAILDGLVTEERQTLRVNEGDFGSMKVRLVL